MAMKVVCYESLSLMVVNGRSTRDLGVNVVDWRATPAKLHCALSRLSTLAAKLLRALGLSLPRLIVNYTFLDEADFRFEIVERSQDLVEDVGVLCCCPPRICACKAGMIRMPYLHQEVPVDLDILLGW